MNALPSRRSGLGWSSRWTLLELGYQAGQTGARMSQAQTCSQGAGMNSSLTTWTGARLG